MTKYPIEIFTYKEEAHDIPVTAWRIDDDDKTVRYLNSELLCDDCIGIKDKMHWCHVGCDVDKVGRPACMKFVSSF